MVNASDTDQGVTYYGFDLFEQFSPEIAEKEFCLKNPPTMATVVENLSSLKATIKLYQGFTNITVPQFVKENPTLKVDFIFIDGGHSTKTITEDWINVLPLIGANTIIVFDDYYTNHNFTDKGCQDLINNLNDNWKVVHLPFTHHFDKFSVNMVKVTPRSTVDQLDL